MDKQLIGISYLEAQDFNPDGSLKSYVNNGKPVVMMVQGNFCGFCTQAKPAFMKFASTTPSIVAVTVQSDGEDSDRKANDIVNSIVPIRGVPAFLGFNKNGVFVAMHEGNRDVASLQAFASKLV